jgi:anaerobic ribonucleoside-triphosphate reductase activating protein
MLVSMSRFHFPVTTLGPGRRIGLWLQGCSIRCPGCISVDTWEAGLGQVSIEDVIARMGEFAQNADGLTISGGEPFEQPEALVELLRAWRTQSNRSALVFTGRDIEDVSPWMVANPSLIDALITGPFRSDLPQTLALRGSDNQTLHVLSDLGREFAQFDRLITPADRKLDVMFDENGAAWLAGIPERGDLYRLRKALAASGHRATTSDNRGSAPR